MKNILSIKNVSYSYHTQEGETPALTDISFDVSSGSFTCIVGPSGWTDNTCEASGADIKTYVSQGGSFTFLCMIRIAYIFNGKNIFHNRAPIRLYLILCICVGSVRHKHSYVRKMIKVVKNLYFFCLIW